MQTVNHFFVFSGNFPFFFPFVHGFFTPAGLFFPRKL